MHFNSPTYIFLFLPIVVLVYFLLNRRHLVKLGKNWLLLASVFFYGYWNPLYLPLLAGSLGVNFAFGRKLSGTDTHGAGRRMLLGCGILANLLLLGYFKYVDFFRTGTTPDSIHFDFFHLALPVGLSFITFQQIAFLIDCYFKRVNETNFLNYSLFVTFFPQLVIGPIVRYREMMPQLSGLRSKLPDYRNYACGLLLIFIGLFKKVVIADNFAIWANQGFDQLTMLNFADAWITSLSFTLQIYFDFSGYTDMALGAACLFNINLPLNFNSPYKALNLTDFWARWHMTLSRWLNDCLYLPFSPQLMAGAGHETDDSTYQTDRQALPAIFLIIILYGLWHGANITFLLWGTFLALATIIHRFWQRRKTPIPHWPAWLLTFGCINFAWVFFRATSIEDALKVFRGMAGLNGYGSPGAFPENVTLLIIVVLIAIVSLPNSMELKERFQPDLKWTCFIIILIATSLFHLTPVHDFFYFRY